MKYEHFWVMCAAASTAIVVIGSAATAAFAQQRSPITVMGARPSDQQRSVRVSYRDLNLAAAHDERILNRRVGTATRIVCDPQGSDAYGDPAFQDCVSFAWDGARPQIALAVRRAHEIAQFGSSSIPLVAIAISVR